MFLLKDFLNESVSPSSKSFPLWPMKLLTQRADGFTNPAGNCRNKSSTSGPTAPASEESAEVVLRDGDASPGELHQAAKRSFNRLWQNVYRSQLASKW